MTRGPPGRSGGPGGVGFFLHIRQPETVPRRVRSAHLRPLPQNGASDSTRRRASGRCRTAARSQRGAPNGRFRLKEWVSSSLWFESRRLWVELSHPGPACGLGPNLLVRFERRESCRPFCGSWQASSSLPAPSRWSAGRSCGVECSSLSGSSSGPTACASLSSRRVCTFVRILRRVDPSRLRRQRG